MFTERNLWLGATTAAIGVLLVLIVQPPPERRAPLFDHIQVYSIVVDPGDRQRLYLGTDLGVMMSIDGGQTWMSEATGSGPVATMWLSLSRTPSGQQQLFAFTHGRDASSVARR